MANSFNYRRRRPRTPQLVGLAILVAATGGAWYLFFSGPGTEDSAPPDAPADVSQAQEPARDEPLPPAPPALPPAIVQESSAPPSPPPTAAVTPEPLTPAVAPAKPADPMTGAADAGSVMAEALASLNSGKIVEARSLLNRALVSGQLSSGDVAAARQMAGEINKTLVFSSRRLPDDPWVISHMVKPGENFQRIANQCDLTARLLQRINNIPDATKLRAGATIKLLKGPFHAIVTKSTFTMDLYLGAPGGEGSMYICTLPVGLGADDSTPTGTWRVAPGKKLINPTYYDPRGQGMVIEADDPKNPLGEFWIGLTGIEGEAVGKLSYGIHGTIEPESVGKMASMGCIRMQNEDVELVYEMLIEGKSTVIVRP